MTIEELNIIMEKEGDYKELIIHGLKCTIERNKTLGTLNGYIYLTTDFNEYGKSELGHIRCHGGINWCEMDGDLWKIGFDCGHWGDLMPAFLGHVVLGLPTSGIYRDMNYVESVLYNIITEELDTTYHDLRIQRESKLKYLDESL